MAILLRLQYSIKSVGIEDTKSLPETSCRFCKAKRHLSASVPPEKTASGFGLFARQGWGGASQERRYLGSTQVEDALGHARICAANQPITISNKPLSA